MSLEKIYIVRHGFRTAWTVDNEGNYRSHIPSPTGIAADPPLTSHGIAQAEELAAHLATLTPAVEAVYSSPYYRCLQTIDPFVRLQLAAASAGTLTSRAADTVRIRGEHGVCEWFGAAPFEHPQPADAAELRGLFPAYDADFVSPVKPRVHGETYAQLVARVRAAMQALIRRCDDEGRRSVVICSHAAVIIVLGRVLTGQHPDEMDTEDFKAFTCGLSVYARGRGAEGKNTDGKSDNVGNWICERNSDCSFLSGGEERGWKFAGDESFPGTGSMSQDDPVESKL
ncbi:phosphoglycerate mutase family protein [Akanthomyces lecanii RCEF 1005]|uniref:Phosphoglycerate mutase family protein n=1 Tax=Akanthomyces lecanii RCEF 1005 TaxID=1081108 RepID=A0A162LRQ9_CORDF|nr:phosphoglycerate mutase family protein [Akanthomyces lecanii RCEF 1005]